MVMATQNPIEQEGTYALPEAQLDRFLLYVRIGYPPAEVERAILELARRSEAQRGEQTGSESLPTPVTRAQLFAARDEVRQLHMAPAVEEYVLQLVLATRKPGAYAQELERWITFGASPRARAHPGMRPTRIRKRRRYRRRRVRASAQRTNRREKGTKIRNQREWRGMSRATRRLGPTVSRTGRQTAMCFPRR